MPPAKTAGRPAADVFLPAPGAGSVSGGQQPKLLGMNRTTVYVIGGVALVVVAYLLWRRSQNAASAAQGAQDSSNIDPATGYPYGSAADLAALGGGSGGSGSGQPGGTTVTTGGTGGDQSGAALDLIASILQSWGPPSTNGQTAQTTAQPVDINLTLTEPAAPTPQPPAPDPSKAPAVGGGGTPYTPQGVVTYQNPAPAPAPYTGPIAYDPAYNQANPEPVSVGTTPPKSPTAPYTTPVSANKTGGSANKKQGVFAIH